MQYVCAQLWQEFQLLWPREMLLARVARRVQAPQKAGEGGERVAGRKALVPIC